jgi:proteasome accessory factor B
MSSRRTERLLNLTICLMAGRRGLSKAQLRSLIADYRDSPSDEAFERMFERDKDDLREMGIPLVTESSDAYFDDQIDYRIDPAAYALPEIEVGPDEMAVLTVAARVWHQAALAPAATAALRKLQAYGPGGEPSDVALDATGLGLEPRVSTSEVAFTPLYNAVRDKQPVRFGYRTEVATETTQRHLEPWGVVSWRGRWYVVGHDTDRAATRAFRLSRIVDTVQTDGEAGTVAAPTDLDPTAVMQMVVPESPVQEATVRVRRGTAHTLRRMATSTEPDGDAHELLVVPFSDAWGFAADVVAAQGVAIAPAELREQCERRLRAVLERHPAAAGSTS